MKILFINSVCGIRSTGRICTDLAEEYMAQGWDVKVAYGRFDPAPQYKDISVRIGDELTVKMHMAASLLFDRHGLASTAATKKFLKWADEYDPDVLWLHNIHGFYLNVKLLFDWIKSRPQMKVKWTLHDCWAFTGHCSYFTIAGCDKWRTHCEHCPQKKEYPISWFADRSYVHFDEKKEWFTGVKDMTLITPSQWLADLVKESFLKEYPVEVKHNDIDRDTFKPTESDFRERYGLEDKIVLLGVALPWDVRKGLKDIIKLASMLSGKYAIVLVGLDDEKIKDMSVRFSNADSKMNGNVLVLSKKGDNESAASVEYTVSDSIAIPSGVDNLYRAITGDEADAADDSQLGVGKIIAMPRTNSPKELAEIYTAADIFIDPTYEDNYPTVNLEALACGTKVITYDTGGCAETLEFGK